MRMMSRRRRRMLKGKGRSDVYGKMEGRETDGGEWSKEREENGGL